MSLTVLSKPLLLANYYCISLHSSHFIISNSHVMSNSVPGTTKKKKVVGLERGALSLVSTTEELLDRKVAAPV
jgi:hypothetical protein